MREFGGSWSESKLECVEDYARRYLQVMQRQEWCSLDYVDAFAGRGRQALKSNSTRVEALDSLFGDEAQMADAEEFLVGSAVRALKASLGSTRPFNKFLFIDSDRSSCAELERTVHAEFPSIENTVQVVCDDAHKALGNYVDSTDWKKTRALVFLDPYGLEVEWPLIERLAATKACDVWYLFPLGGVIRMMTKDGKMQASWEAGLDRVFGTRDWRDEFYKTNPQQTLLGIEDPLRVRDVSTTHVVDYIRARLSGVFAGASNAGVLYNSKGSPLFALVLGVANPSPSAQRAARNIANHLIKGLNQP
jgi:three-Cys-motif partner protein